MTQTQDGKEVYTATSSAAKRQAPSAPIAASSGPTRAPPRPVEEEEDLDAPVTPGTKCRHNGCKANFISDEESRRGEGPGTVCTYHPAAVRHLSLYVEYLF